MYAAVGRRLGYPLRLVSAVGRRAGHLFVRWDEPGERFNFEASLVGCDTPADDHYRGLDGGMGPELERRGLHLVSQTPRQELAGFLAQRACRWLDLGGWRQAVTAFAWAASLSPHNRSFRDHLMEAMNAWAGRLRDREPPGFPEMHVLRWPPRRFPETLPWHFERNLLALEAWENALQTPEWDAHLWEPMRRGLPLRRPTAAIVEPRPGGGCGIMLSFGTQNFVTAT